MDAIAIEKIKTAPKDPGVYIYTNSQREIIYVGKAKNLKNRLTSYLRIKQTDNTKTFYLVNEVHDVSLIKTFSEFEALILEAELIKKHLPKYNISLKDDKSYLYIVIKNELLPVGKVPKLQTARRTQLSTADEYFGPFPDGSSVKSILRMVRRIFPYRDCTTGKFKKYHKLNSPCLYGHLGLCPAPCSGDVPANLVNTRKQIRNIKRILQGEMSKVVEEFEKKMYRYSKQQSYERAAYYRNVLEKFNYVRQNFHSPEEYIQNPRLIEDTRRKTLEQLLEVLPHLHKIPTKIECYDISNVSGTSSVGSLVTAINGSIDPTYYKKFKIKTKNSPDDFHMLAEVLERRLKRGIKQEKGWELPELLVIDGGKGQVSAVLTVCTKLGVGVPVIGLAKKFETIVYFDEADRMFKELALSKDSLALTLLINLRNEAHRFAKKYHHQLRLQTLSS